MHTPRTRSWSLSCLLVLTVTSCNYDRGEAPPPTTEQPSQSTDTEASGGASNGTATTTTTPATSPSTRLDAAPAPLDVGTVVPPFVLANATQALDSRGPLANGPLVLVFYIGDFCVYCRRQLTALQQRKAEFDAAHATLWGVSADTTAVSHGLENDLGLGYPLGSDPTLDVIRAFGVASEGTQTARPSVFVLMPDPNGARVAWRQVGVGQADRAGIDDILTAVRGGQPAPTPAGTPPATTTGATAAEPAAQPAQPAPASEPAAHPARTRRRGRGSPSGVAH